MCLCVRRSVSPPPPPLFPRADLTEAGSFLRIVAVTYGGALVGALGLWRPLSSWLQLIELPTTHMKLAVAGLILADAVSCFAAESLIRLVYGVGVPVTVHE